MFLSIATGAVPELFFICVIRSAALLNDLLVLHTGGVEIQLRMFLTLALGGGEWSTSPPGCFTSREEP